MTPTPILTATPYALGYLAAVLDTDAGIYHEARPNGRRRASLDVEVSDRVLADRIAGLIGAGSVVERPAKSRGPIAFTRSTFRVRVRGEAARQVLDRMKPLVTPDTRRRIETVLAATAGVGTDSPYPGSLPTETA